MIDQATASAPAVDQAPADVPAVLKWAVWVIEKVGVPTAIAAYVLFSLGPKLDRLSNVIEQRIPIQTVQTK